MSRDTADICEDNIDDILNFREELEIIQNIEWSYKKIKEYFDKSPFRSTSFRMFPFVADNREWFEVIDNFLRHRIPGEVNTTIFEHNIVFLDEHASLYNWHINVINGYVWEIKLLERRRNKDKRDPPQVRWGRNISPKHREVCFPQLSSVEDWDSEE